jgi:hypothetical protein
VRDGSNEELTVCALKYFPEFISRLLLAAVLLAVTSLAIAQQGEDTSEPEPTDQRDSSDQQTDTSESVDQAAVSIEQITVTAQRTFFTLRSQIEDAKEALYSSYNDLNIDDELDVNCRSSDWTGTHIREQVCWPVFFEIAVSENSQDYMRGIAVLEPVAQLEAQYKGRFEELRANIIKVASENPEVEDALMKLGYLEATYERKRQECMEQTPFLLIFGICR